MHVIHNCKGKIYIDNTFMQLHFSSSHKIQYNHLGCCLVDSTQRLKDSVLSLIFNSTISKGILLNIIFFKCFFLCKTLSSSFIFILENALFLDVLVFFVSSFCHLINVLHCFIYLGLQFWKLFMDYISPPTFFSMKEENKLFVFIWFFSFWMPVFECAFVGDYKV